jgi:hypothetical protein
MRQTPSDLGGPIRIGGGGDAANNAASPLARELSVRSHCDGVRSVSNQPNELHQVERPAIVPLAVQRPEHDEHVEDEGAEDEENWKHQANERDHDQRG